MPNKLITLEELKGLLRSKVVVSTSLRAAARDLEVSAAYLSKILRTKSAKVGPSLVNAIGYEAVTMYQKQQPKRKGK